MLNNKLSIRKLEIKNPPLNKEGGRIVSNVGEIAQIINGDTYQFLAYIDFSTESNNPRGNHYHDIKEEFIYVISGKLVAIYEDIETKEREQVILEPGNLVIVKPKCSHVYFPKEYSQIIEFSPTPYDPNDTYKYVISTSCENKDKD